MLFACKITIPKQTEDNKTSCLVTQIIYEIGYNYGVAPTKIIIKIYNDNMKNEFIFGVKSKIYVDKIKIGLYDRISIYPVFSHDYILDAPVEENNSIFPLKLKINENSLVILPYKIIVKNNNMQIKLLRQNFEKEELMDVIKALLKSINFKDYKYLYIGNKNITGIIGEIKDINLSN